MLVHEIMFKVDVMHVQEFFKSVDVQRNYSPRVVVVGIRRNFHLLLAVDPFRPQDGRKEDFHPEENYGWQIQRKINLNFVLSKLVPPTTTATTLTFLSPDGRR